MSELTLRIRDERDIRVSREALMDLPESVLILLFPNGVVLNSPPNRQDADASELDDEDVYYVEFDPQCLEFILAFFEHARTDFYGGPRPVESDQAQSLHNPLFHKQAIIVLREELEWFGIPTPGDPEKPATDADGTPNAALLELKRQCGNHLLARRSIFTALQRNVNRENNVAEQHLIDMLCMSGFSREDEWGYRAIEPNRCCISSIALVLLKTGISHPSKHEEASAGAVTAPGMPKPGVTVNAAQLATAQKLLLFWRKPARKWCWDQTEVDLAVPPAASPTGNASPATSQRPVKVWARRVWTLELSIL